MTLPLDIWSLIAFGIGFWMLMDGLIVGAVPALVRRLMMQMRDMSVDELRLAGLLCSALGAAIVFAILRF